MHKITQHGLFIGWRQKHHSHPLKGSFLTKSRRDGTCLQVLIQMVCSWYVEGTLETGHSASQSLIPLFLSLLSLLPCYPATLKQRLV